MACWECTKSAEAMRAKWQRATNMQVCGGVDTSAATKAYLLLFYCE